MQGRLQFLSNEIDHPNSYHVFRSGMYTMRHINEFTLLVDVMILIKKRLLCHQAFISDRATSTFADDKNVISRDTESVYSHSSAHTKICPFICLSTTLDQLV